LAAGALCVLALPIVTPSRIEAAQQQKVRQTPAKQHQAWRRYKQIHRTSRPPTPAPRLTNAKKYMRPLPQSKVAQHLRRPVIAHPQPHPLAPVNSKAAAAYVRPQPVAPLTSLRTPPAASLYGLRPQRMTVGTQFYRGFGEHRYLYRVAGPRRLVWVDARLRVPAVGHRIRVRTWDTWYQPWRRYVVVASTGVVLWSFGCPLGACDRIVAACKSGNHDVALSLLETAAVEDSRPVVAAAPACGGPSPCPAAVPCPGPS